METIVNPCEGYELAIEMKLHGALDPISTPKLEVHLRSCAGCRGFAESSRATEELLQHRANAAVDAADWSALRKQVNDLVAVHRRMIFVPLALLMGLMAMRLMHGLESLDWRKVFDTDDWKWDLGIFVGLWIIFGLYHRIRIRLAHRAKSDEDLIEFCRREFDAKLRWLRVIVRVMWSFALLMALISPLIMLSDQFSSKSVLSGLWVLALFVGPGLFVQRILIPRAKRDRAGLN